MIECTFADRPSNYHKKGPESRLSRGPQIYDGASDTHSCTRFPHVVRAHSSHSVSTARLCSVWQINLRYERRVGTQTATCGTLTICSQNMRGGSCFLQAYVRRDGALICIRFYFLEPKNNTISGSGKRTQFWDRAKCARKDSLLDIKSRP